LIICSNAWMSATGSADSPAAETSIVGTPTAGGSGGCLWFLLSSLL
jgi:hypothetical protein